MSEKLHRLQLYLREQQLDGLLLTRRDNVAWLTEGATFYVVDRSETGVASLLIKAEGVTLIAPDNEIQRLLAEESLPFPFETVNYPWYSSLNDVLARLQLLHPGSDVPLPNTLMTDLVALRTGLNSNERERFAQLGQQVSRAVEKVARGIRPGVTERQVEANLYAECLSLGIRPVCTLIAADERIESFKHPVPGPKAVRHRMLITLGAEQHGLNISLSRMVHFGEPSACARQRLLSVAEIHADMLAASRPGRAWQSIFTDIQASYAFHGFPEAWQQHHQGGPAGYGCRDSIISPTSTGQLATHQVLAWNPTLSGVKSEETILLSDEGLQFLTRTEEWPTLSLQRGDNVWTFADWLVLEP